MYCIARLNQPAALAPIVKNKLVDFVKEPIRDMESTVVLISLISEKLRAQGKEGICFQQRTVISEL